MQALTFKMIPISFQPLLFELLIAEQARQRAEASQRQVEAAAQRQAEALR